METSDELLSAGRCLSCASVDGVRRISPGRPIAEGRLWVVEHAYPARLRGWLVIVLKRHAEALHELTAEEWAELGALQRRAVELLRAELSSEKEYLASFAEAPGFRHVHVHVIPKAASLPEEFWGPGVFALLRAEEAGAEAKGLPITPPNEVEALCRRFHERWRALFAQG